MSLCINPKCQQPQNPENILFCLDCGSELLLAGRYRVTQLLSRKGGFGLTYEILHNDIPKVLKVLTHNHPKAIELFQQEARVLGQLNHPGIPKGDDDFIFFPKKSQEPVNCLVMEKIYGMDLEEYLKERDRRPIDQKLALEWLTQLANILHEVHSQQYFHRDIKPSNIILRPDGQLVLIDFGAVRQVTATILAGGKTTGIYTPGYAPVEQQKGRAMPKSDFFALGRTFVYLLTGTHPTDSPIYDPNTDELHWRNHTSNISPLLADFIDTLMAEKASDRPADAEVILQRVQEIKSSLYNSALVSNKSRQRAIPAISQTNNASQQLFTRRNLILVGAGFVVAIVLGKGFIRDGQNLSGERKKTPQPVSLKPQPPTSLATCEFEVVTVDARGNQINRQRQQAEFYREDLGSGIILDMISIPEGSFLIGSPDTEWERQRTEGPQHQLAVAPFFMGKFPVTQAQWKAVASLPPINLFLNPDPSAFKGDNLPVENISWHEAIEFCARLSQKTGRTYRLPGEAEWEYSCRAGTTTPFHFGETITPNLANYDGNYIYNSGPKGKYRQETTVVGSFQVANAFGLYDMHGNVLEWCADPWRRNCLGAPTDGSGWELGGKDSSRCLRGGSWLNGPRYCRSAYRTKNAPDGRDSNLGFRLAVSSVRTL